jgi:hypothetical protein
MVAGKGESRTDFFVYALRTPIIYPIRNHSYKLSTLTTRMPEANTEENRTESGWWGDVGIRHIATSTGNPLRILHTAAISPSKLLTRPKEWIALTLPHDHRAHKHLDRTDTFERDLALSGGRVKTQDLAQVLLGDGRGVVDLVSEDEERHLAEVLHAQQRIELGLRLEQTLVVLGVDEEHDARDLGEVVFPETAR